MSDNLPPGVSTNDIPGNRPEDVDFRVLDAAGNDVTVGMRVIFGAPDAEEVEAQTGTVTAISEPDGDYDDELQRGVEITPRVTVIFADDTAEIANTRNITRVTWADYPDGPAEMIYQADDLEVVL